MDMKKLSMMLAAVALTLAMASCEKKTAVDLAGEWKVVELNGTEVPETMQAPALAFDTAENTYSGATGANILHGEFTFENGNLTLGEAGVTQMMADSISMVVEGAYLKAIAAVKTVAEENGSLLLKDESGNTLVKLSK